MVSNKTQTMRRKRRKGGENTNSVVVEDLGIEAELSKEDGVAGKAVSERVLLTRLDDEVLGNKGVLEGKDDETNKEADVFCFVLFLITESQLGVREEEKEERGSTDVLDGITGLVEVVEGTTESSNTEGGLSVVLESKEDFTGTTGLESCTRQEKDDPGHQENHQHEVEDAQSPLTHLDQFFFSFFFSCGIKEREAIKSQKRVEEGGDEEGEEIVEAV